MRNKFKPVLVLVSDLYGDVLYPSPAPMMREHLGLSQRQLAQQATREILPRDVTPKIRPLVPAPKAPGGWLGRWLGWR